MLPSQYIDISSENILDHHINSIAIDNILKLSSVPAELDDGRSRSLQQIFVVFEQEFRDLLQASSEGGLDASRSI